MRTLYTNIQIATPEGILPGSVLIEDETIAGVYTKGEDVKADKIIDGDKLTMLPGFTDTHCHLRDPGLTYKEDINSGLSAAAKGGFTTVCAMANTVPVINEPVQILTNLEKADRLDKVNLIQIAAVSRDFKEPLNDLNELKDLTPIVSNDGHNIDDPNIMREALEQSASNSIIIATHNEPEFETIRRDLKINQDIGGNLHLCHVSLKEVMDLLREAKNTGQTVTCEVTPHHIYFSDINFKVHPPFRSEEDRIGLIEAIKEGLVNNIATDHAPHSPEDKAAGSPGLIGFETAFGAVNKVFSENAIPLTTLVDLMCQNPAKLLHLDGGSIIVGAPADLVLVDPDEEWTVKEEELISRSKNTPFIGETLKGRVHRTLHNGRVSYDSGRI